MVKMVIWREFYFDHLDFLSGGKCVAIVRHLAIVVLCTTVGDLDGGGIGGQCIAPKEGKDYGVVLG